MVRASGLRGYRKVMRELGEDPIPLLMRFGIPSTTLDNDEALVSLEAACALLEASSDIADCPDLGLRISQHQDLGILGALGIAMQNAPTPFEALKTASRFLFIHSPGMRLSIQDKSALHEDAFEVSFTLFIPERLRQRQTIDLCLGTTFQVSRLLNPDSFRLVAATLPHSPTAALKTYNEYFDAPTVPDQVDAALHISKRGWNEPTPNGNPSLKGIVEDYLSRHFQDPRASNTDRVRSILRPLMGTEQASREDIADLLAVHPRTLHRRLTAEGTTFQAVKDNLRREMAQRYLTESDVPIGQISLMLGYPEQSSFSRACVNWFGQSPRSFRQDS